MGLQKFNHKFCRCGLQVSLDLDLIVQPIFPLKSIFFVAAFSILDGSPLPPAVAKSVSYWWKVHFC